MKTISQRVAEQVEEAAEQAKQAAIEAAKGTSYIDANGNLMSAPTTAQLAAWTDEQVRAIIGQAVAPPLTGWRMSNNSLSKRVDTAQAAIDAVPRLMTDLHDSMLVAMQTLLAQQADQFTAALTAQAQDFTAQLAQARTDLHTEILGSAGPLLDTINQIKALDLADDASDADIHNQLFALLGAQSQQLTQLLSATGTLTTNQQAAAGSRGQLQTTVGGQAADIAALKLVDAGLRADLTSTTAKLDTTTATANGSQATAAGLLTSVGALTTTVNGHTADLAKRLRNDQNDGTAFNLTAKKATAAGQVVIYEQLGDRQRTATVTVAAQAISVGQAATATVAWPTPFADNNYVIAQPSGSNSSLLGGQWVLSSQTPAGCVWKLNNSTLVAINMTSGTLQFTATHN